MSGREALLLSRLLEVRQHRKVSRRPCAQCAYFQRGKWNSAAHVGLGRCAVSGKPAKKTGACYVSVVDLWRKLKQDGLAERG